MEPEPTEVKRRRGIYLLPNLFTTAGLFAGFYAIVAAIGGRYAAAAVAVYVAMILDSLDGRVARLTNTQTAFGVEYDSLSDMVSFGLAPALVMYEWSLSSLATHGWLWAKLGWLAAFIYTAGAALRLARFNTQVGTLDKRYFQGLPSPAAAAVVVGLVWVGDEIGLRGSDLILPAFILTVGTGMLMVSNIRYYSFKEVDFVRRVPFVAILLVVMAFVLASIDPPKVLFFSVLVYAASGPLHTLYQLRRHRAQRRAGGGTGGGSGRESGPRD
ncbi:MAG: CDP-diacylglycerol--serine O-phosphatidyltransferase [Chromatiales bacterium 21-64-14]|nr:MAG: CDP-diacylglycerol--serine O-phosphatidyltransferase [Chromatiales bacterium 21-64-14]HQU14786.1 CDP-diacylglycerol--serine O-phosphatidyltransferase [Gammaproteobacteria bacterium]